jgi:hypothetical protein
MCLALSVKTTFMKTKILLGISFLFYFAEAALSCDFYIFGKMYITDENNKSIPNTVVYLYKTLGDSFIMDENYYSDEQDSNAYFFTSHTSWRVKRKNDSKPADKFMRISAPGYADVIITKLHFEGDGDLDHLPTIYIKMYSRKYVNKGDLVTLISQYVCEKSLNVKDSLTIGLNDYNQSIRSETSVETANRNASFIVRTYPNPVLDKLSIEINTPIIKPYTAKLIDVQGRMVVETELSDMKSVLDMQWEAKGMYFIQVYDPEGVLLYALKFLKA